MRRWALHYALQTALTAFDVVYLGEHFVVDVVAGIGLAAVVRSLPRPIENVARSFEITLDRAANRPNEAADHPANSTNTPR